MATILNAYNLTGGDTTSSTFTSTGDCVTVEATTTNVSGNNTYLKIQSSDDQSTWKDIGQMIIGVGSDIYCIDPIKLTGLYVRVLLITNDTLTGTITVTATNPTGGGDLLAANNLSDVASAATANNNLGNTHLTYTPTCVTTVGGGTLTPLNDCFVIVVDADSVSFTFYFQIDLGGGENDNTFTFTLPTGHLPTNNFAASTELQFVMGLPNAGTWDETKNIQYNATVGAKTGTIAFHSDVAADTIKLTAFITYHK